jgi:hypothetical protein
LRHNKLHALHLEAFWSPPHHHRTLDMTLDWDQHKDKIEDLYITKRKALTEVRRVLKDVHGFDAS